MSRRRTDAIGTPKHLSVAKPIRPGDLDRRVTHHGIYLSLPASPGVPWSAYVRSQRIGSRSVSSSTDALDSDQARHTTQRILQHTRSLPTDSQSLTYHQQIGNIGQTVGLVISTLLEHQLQPVQIDQFTRAIV